MASSEKDGTYEPRRRTGARGWRAVPRCSSHEVLLTVRLRCAARVAGAPPDQVAAAGQGGGRYGPAIGAQAGQPSCNAPGASLPMRATALSPRPCLGGYCCLGGCPGRALPLLALLLPLLASHLLGPAATHVAEPSRCVGGGAAVQGMYTAAEREARGRAEELGKTQVRCVRWGMSSRARRLLTDRGASVGLACGPGGPWGALGF
jgi:hypothetical protein